MASEIMIKKVLTGVSLLILVLSLAACSSTSTRNPKQFLTEKNKLSRGKYFTREYVMPGTDFVKYRKVKVSPVETAYLQDREQFTSEEINELALQFQQDIEKQLSEKYQILTSQDETDEETIVINPAFIQLGAPGSIASPEGSGISWVPLATTVVTFQATITAGDSGEILAEVEDKKSAGKNARFLPADAYKKFVHVKAAFKEWARSFLRMLQNH